MTSSNVQSCPLTTKASWSKRLLFRLLDQLDNSRLCIHEQGAVHHFGNAKANLAATITINDARCYQRMLWGGSIGAAEAYVEGLWHTDDLPSVIRIFARNLAKLERYEQRFSVISRLINRLHHRANSNSKAGSRTNIAAHYDLSNAMYQRFLDPAMQYSSAIFPTADASLAQAQQHKMALICDYLQLNENDHLLEVGTGWGGLACYAAKHYGCRVTTTTISAAQYELAQERVAAEGLTDKVTLLLADYRDLNGQYSKIVSVEMIEAVGHEYLGTYFSKLNALLRPGGKLMLQAITMNDQRYERYCNDVDFIQKYIFPGGHLPSLSSICEQQKHHTQLYMDHLADYRHDYARTLHCWREQFLKQKPAITALGFNDDFIRLWDYYFSYCEGAFREQLIGLAHIGFIKQGELTL